MEDDPTDDKDFFSVEADEIAIPTDYPQNNTSNEDKIQDASGATSSVSETPVSADFSNVSKTKDDPPVSESLHDSSLHFRDDNSIHSQRNGQNKMQGDNQEDLNNTKGDGVMYKKSRGFSYYPLLHYKPLTKHSITNTLDYTLMITEC